MPKNKDTESLIESFIPSIDDLKARGQYNPSTPMTADEKKELIEELNQDELSNSEIAKVRWQDPVYRELMSESNSISGKIRWADPAVRKQLSDTMKNKFTDPAYSTKQIALMKESRELKRSEPGIADVWSKAVSKGMTNHYYHVDDPDIVYYGQKSMAIALDTSVSAISGMVKNGIVIKEKRRATTS